MVKFDTNLIREILTSPRYSGERFLIVLTAALSLAVYLPANYSLKNQLNCIQQVLMPLIITSMLVSKLPGLTGAKRLRMGFILGACVGGSIVSVYMALGIIFYYFLGQREIAYAAAGLPLLPLSETLLRDLLSWTVSWFANTITSAVAGAVGSLFPRFRRSRWEVAGSEADPQSETMPEVLEYTKSDGGSSRPEKRWLGYP